MPAKRVERRLSAILAADVVGYSRLMGADERGTYQRLKALRREIVDPAIAEYAGRIVKLMGDGLLAEFASAVNAVECAIAVQRAVTAAGADRPEDEVIRLRIGVNLGDVMVEHGDIHGDGVNVAARLEALAEPGGVCISEDLYRYVRNKMDVTFEDLGERRLKNIASPLRVYRIAAPARAVPTVGPTAGARTPAAPAPLTVPDRPSIVVLPFDNMSGDPEQAYFSDGIAEDVITDLSKISGLFVIARNSAFTYRGRHLNLKEVCRELGVRYALEGSVRKAGNRVRITAQLIDGTSGGHVWAERYDRELTDIFAVQDEVTHEIVAALKVELTPEEERGVERRGTSSVEAYEWSLRARELIWLHERSATHEARGLFERAIDVDPGFAAAHAGIAFGHVLDYINRWSEDPERSLEQAAETADRAIRLDEREPLGHFVLGIVHLWSRRLDEARAAAERCLALDPNYADGYALLGQVLHYAGRSEEALAHYATMARLNPHHPSLYLHFVAQCHYVLGHYAEAASALRQRLIRQPASETSQVLLAACCARLGRIEEARAAWQEAKRINPEYAIEDRRRALPYKDPADFEKVVEGLRMADLPV